MAVKLASEIDIDFQGIYIAKIVRKLYKSQADNY